MKRTRWAVLTAMVMGTAARNVPAAAAPIAAFAHDAARDAPPWARTKAFPTTRAYVAPASTLVLSFDADAAIGTTDAAYVHENARYGMWLGLGHRLALEASLQVQSVLASGTLSVKQQALHVRWAWADWGVLATNPALALNVAFNSAASPTLGLQLSLADGWGYGPWALDVSFARELRGTTLAQTYGLVAAMAYACTDVGVDVGLELNVHLTAGETGEGSGFSFEPTEALVLGGPYVRWTPVPEASVIFNVGVGAEFQWVNKVQTQIPVVTPKLTLAWSL